MERNIKLLAIFNFFTDLKFHSAILVLYFLSVTGSFTLSMSLFSVVYVSSALLEIPTGIFSDFIGRKKTVVLGAVAAVLSAFFYALGFSYWWLLVGAIFDGLSRSWYSGNNDALLHDTLTEIGRSDDYDHYLGKTHAMFQVALTIGSVLGGFLAFFSFAWAMWLSVIPQIFCLLTSTLIRNPASQNKKESANIFSHLHLSALHLWKNKNLRLLSLNSVVNFAIGESTFNFRAAFVKTLWPLWAIGIATMLANIGASLSFWLSGNILRKIDAFKIKLYANIFNKLINIVSVTFPTILSPILMASTSLLYGVSSVAGSTLMQREYTQEQRATLSSLNSFLGSLFYGVFAIFIGFIGDKLGPAKALLISYIISLPMIYVTWLLVKTNKER